MFLVMNKNHFMRKLLQYKIDPLSTLGVVNGSYPVEDVITQINSAIPKFTPQPLTITTYFTYDPPRGKVKTTSCNLFIGYYANSTKHT